VSYGEKNIIVAEKRLRISQTFCRKHAYLISLLQAVLDLPVEEYEYIQVVDPNLKREYIDDKLGILDIKIFTTKKTVIDVEIQNRQQAFIWKRLLFYDAKLTLEQIHKGEKYENINKVIIIYIADHILIKENSVYHHCFQLYDVNTKIYFPDSHAIHTLELPKVHKPDGTLLCNWLQFLKAKEEDDFMELAQTNPAIAEAWEVIKVLSGDERMRAMADDRDKAYMDYNSNISAAHSEGIQIGEQKGRREERLAVAVNLLRDGIPVEKVAKLTGLTIDEVDQIAAGLAD
jgi:predicted transposase/invertase (TIGR01784 family)